MADTFPDYTSDQDYWDYFPGAVDPYAYTPGPYYDVTDPRMWDPGYEPGGDLDPFIYDPSNPFGTGPLDPSGDTGGGGLGAFLRGILGIGGDLVGGARDILGGIDPTNAAMMAALAAAFDNTPEENYKLNLYPEYDTAGSRAAVDYALGLLNKPVEAYSGQFTAGMDPLESQARGMNSDMVGAWAPGMDEAMGFYRSAANPFTSADIGSYMNPYIENAIDPVARMMKQDQDRQLNDLNSRAAMQGAFGEERNILERNLMKDRGERQISDLYSQGYKQAFDTGSNLWSNDMARLLSAGNALQGGTIASAGLGDRDITRTSTLGAVNRGIAQSDLDKRYEDWIRQQKEPYAKLSGTVSAVGGTRQSPSVLSTTPAPSLTNRLVSLGATLTGLGRTQNQDQNQQP